MGGAISICCYSLSSTIFRAACLPLHVVMILLETLWSLARTVVPPRPPPRHVLITGAASGMGRALALHFASTGATVLSLADIDPLGLAETSSLAQNNATERRRAAKELSVDTAVVDCRDAEAMQTWVCARDADAAAGPVDLALAVAGTIESRVRGGRGLDDLELGARGVVAVNVSGVVNTVLPAVACMRRRGRGQVGVLASLASLDGFNALYPAYAASKAFAAAWALGLRAHLRGSGVVVNVFAPGAVRTPLLAAPRGLDPHYDLASRAPAWISHAPCVELSPQAAAAAWAAGLARDEALTRTHHTYSLCCADPCTACPLQVHDLISRMRLHLLWGWRPLKAPRHAWLIATAASDSPPPDAAAAGNEVGRGFIERKPLLL